MVEFKCYIHGHYRTIQLVNGENMTLTYGGPTDEGYSHSAYGFTCDENSVTMTVETQASDCDGRLDTSGEWTCQLDNLASFLTPDGEGTPEWEEVSNRQRDYNAEAAGY